MDEYSYLYLKEEPRLEKQQHKLNSISFIGLRDLKHTLDLGRQGIVSRKMTGDLEPEILHKMVG